MKTYKLNEPLERPLLNVTIPFEKVLFDNQWNIFDPNGVTEKMVFLPDGTFKVHRCDRITFGNWDYQGGDAFHLSLDGVSYGLHFVHLDSNLAIFELHDTKQYFILLSDKCRQTIDLTTLESIEYYLKKLKDQLTDGVHYVVTPAGLVSSTASNLSSSAFSRPTSTRTSSTSTSSTDKMAARPFHGPTTYVLPVLMMGGLYASSFGTPKTGDDAKDHHGTPHDELYREGYQDEYDEEFESDETIFPDDDDENALSEEYDDDSVEDFDNDFNEEYAEDFNNDFNEEYTEDINEDNFNEEYTQEFSDDNYDDYGGLTEEEVIYDYLESQEES